jgi:hypothetical protein
MNRRLWRGRAGVEKAEVAPFVGLRYFVEEKRKVTALHGPRFLFPSRFAGGEFRFGYISVSARSGTSSAMRSPSRTKARGPPIALSGATCRTHAP